MNDRADNNLRPLKLLPWWAAALGGTAVAVSIAATTLWLLSIARKDPSLRFEAIKIGLSIGAGTGAAFALILSFRRQWLSERGQAHIEGVARGTAYDAEQRRITELYGRAVEQLGHERAAVRLGGLYSLERLAQDEPAIARQLWELSAPTCVRLSILRIMICMTLSQAARQSQIPKTLI